MSNPWITRDIGQGSVGLSRTINTTPGCLGSGDRFSDSNRCLLLAKADPDKPRALTNNLWHQENINNAIKKIRTKAENYYRYDKFRHLPPNKIASEINVRKDEIDRAIKFFNEISNNINKNGAEIFTLIGDKEYYGDFLYTNLHKLHERIRTGGKGNTDAIVDSLAMIANAYNVNKGKIGTLGAGTALSVYKALHRVLQKLVSYDTHAGVLDPSGQSGTTETVIILVGKDWPQPVYKYMWPRNQTDKWYREVQEKRSY